MAYRLLAIAASLLLVAAVLAGCADNPEIVTTANEPTTTLAANPTAPVTEATAAPITTVAPSSTAAPTVTTAVPTTVAPTTTHAPKTTATPTTRTAAVSAAAATSDDAEVQARKAVAYLANLVVSGNVGDAKALVMPEAQSALAEMVHSLSDPLGYRIAGVRSSTHSVVVTVSFEDSKGTKSFVFTVRVEGPSATVTGIDAG